jgi:hypothetical protein
MIIGLQISWRLRGNSGIEGVFGQKKADGRNVILKDEVSEYLKY